MSKCMDGEVVYVQTYEKESVLFQWGVEGCGFGEITFYYKDGKLQLESECMGKEFVKKILNAFIDEAELIE